MRMFKLNDVYSVICESESTRSGFRHIAKLLRGGYERASAKCTYQNRTWEAYEFETVILKLIDANFEGQEKDTFRQSMKWENKANW
jgi:hypothetical protein